MRLLPQEVLRRKREGHPLDAEEIRFLVRGITDGTLGDAQVGALAMAVAVRGMDIGETAELTLSMRDSGTVLAWPHLEGPVLDKHSTGGVGDKVSLVLAPLVAACGGFVPMISGRGLGHTGGTLDKLESIPGYDAQPTVERFQRTVREVGCAIVGQTADLAPADRRLYAIRDVTGTVESLPLITASILSKKLAAGLDALVMDVKVGSGAFLPSPEQARALAEAIATVAERAGLACRALLTDMGQCLGRTAGNALEVLEAVAMLRGEPADPRLEQVVLALAAELLVTGGLAADHAIADSLARDALGSGRAAERFARMVRILGGPAHLLDRPAALLPRAEIVREVMPEEPGVVTAVDARALGLAVVALGGGRTRPEDPVDPAVGLAGIAGRGEAVGPDAPLAIVHARSVEAFEATAARVRAAMRVEPLRPGEAAPPPVVIGDPRRGALTLRPPVDPRGRLP